MSQLILAEQSSAPSTPSSGKVALYVDNTGTPNLKLIDDTATIITQLDDKVVRRGFSTAGSSGYAADTYLAGSSVQFPSGRPPVAGCLYHLVFDMVKTAAGAATPILIIRFGTAGAIADTARITFTWAAGTAAIDTGIVEVYVHFRSVGAAGVAAGSACIAHHLAATGLTATGASGQGIILAASAGFDTTVANSFIGASFNGGASFAGTGTFVRAELFNLSA